MEHYNKESRRIPSVIRIVKDVKLTAKNVCTMFVSYLLNILLEFSLMKTIHPWPLGNVFGFVKAYKKYQLETVCIDRLGDNTTLV